MDDQEINYDNVIETLFTTFSGIIEKDVIATVVESYGGDLNQSANALMSIAGDVNPGNFNQPQPEFGNNFAQSLNNVIPTYTNFHNNSQVARPYVHVPQLSMPVENHHFPQSAPSPMLYAQPSQPNTPVENNPFQVQGPSPMSYANVSQQNKPVENNSKPEKVSELTPLKKIISNTYWTDQIREVIASYNKGWRVLIIMRGPPGCGKSFLSQEILQMTVGDVKNTQTHIMCTDDFFFVRGVYKHDKSRIPEAHMWNQRRAQKAMEQGVSPIIIDNTNIAIWEMEPYAKAAIKNGYIVNVVEPQTPWAKNPSQLFRKNIHRVPFVTIQRMLENYQGGITGDKLIHYCGIKYPEHLTPPVLRKFPPLPVEIKSIASEVNSTTEENVQNQNVKIEENAGSELEAKFQSTHDRKLESSDKNFRSEYKVHGRPKTTDKPVKTKKDEQESERQNIDYKEVEKCLEEIQKVENAWDNGENWEDDDRKPSTPSEIQTSSAASSKPQRNKETLPKPLISIDHMEDWSKLSDFPAVSQPSTSCIKEAKADKPAVQKITSSTCFEIGDADISNDKNPFKIITTVARDINMFVTPKIEKIPNQRMFDKSTSTNNELILMKPVRCQNEEQHFKAFRKMFNHIPSAPLRDIFENCCGDVNWAVEIVIDGMENKQFGVSKEGDLSDDEDTIDNSAPCDCLAAYNVIPDNRSVAAEKPNPTVEAVIEENNASTATPKKIRKEMPVSDISMQLKRQIEKNVVISDTHYSEHCLKIRNLRRGEQDEPKENVENISKEETNDTIITTPATPVEEASTVQDIDDLPSTSTKTSEDTKQEVQSEIDEDDCCGVEEVEKTVNITIGSEFVQQLDQLFGREDMKYPDYVVPKINVPVSMLNEINAMWMESLMHQLEQDSKQTEAMIEQDAEFARELAKKEEEFLLAGKKSEIPDFQEIMDLDYALSLYHKDIDEWRNNEPLNLAAKLSRNKLYNLFPDISTEVLSEILMAHDNNFQDTVEAVLLSMGKIDVVRETDGVRRFVINKELEIKQKSLEEKSKALSEVEWPLLAGYTNIRMEDVNEFRAEASRHKELRQKSYQKARDYIKRGMLSTASFYTTAGALHTRLFDQAHSKACVSLAEVNAQRCRDNLTLDLHNYRVCESMESLDLFLDVHIQKLREMNGRNGVRAYTLFFITGRGAHSSGGPKVKPACQRRLRQRGLSYYELNPGLLGAKVSAHHKLSDEIA